MKLGRWKVTYLNLWRLKELEWLYNWQFRFIGLTVLLTDLGGLVVIFNFGVKWEKMFKKPR